MASSDKGTVHVFAIRTGADDVSNSKSSLKRLLPGERDVLQGTLRSRVLPVYFSSEWSFAQSGPKSG